MFSRLDALGRFLLKRMHDPNLITELDGINHSKRITAKCQGDLEYAVPRPRIGFAMSALPPFAAIVKAARQIDFAPSWKVSNSFNAALTHETGRVRRGIAIRLGTVNK